MRVKILVSGIVQGVGFRPFVYHIAVADSLAGYVRNLGDAGVEVLLEGDAQNIKKFTQQLTSEKPILARIEAVKSIELTGKNEYDKFTIIESSRRANQPGSIIPPDISICNQCLKELRTPTDPRHNYFFINCTDCGPRFTIIERLPYDRENTTMRDFPLCGFCQREYGDPANRRFHAQTVACPACGPKVYLTSNDGEYVQAQDPVREAGKLLSQGKILAVKGYGGFHIAASTQLEEPLQRLRATKHRVQKPFAIMAKSLEVVKSFANLNDKEQELLTSPARPIVLLNKNGSCSLSPLVAPHLHNIGVMLPYTGLHYMLFDEVPDSAFVMTSANPPNQPIVKDNEEALQTLGGTVDYFLFHNRQVAHRCDDSVIRLHNDRTAFLRRSRGYAPAPVMLNRKARRCVAALGAELNTTSCILYEDKAFISQHIGDAENVETRKFLQEATLHLQNLTNTQPEMVACDLHPKFTTSEMAKTITEVHGLKLSRVQHHHAHAAALLAEHNLDEIVAVACDGYGYGTDGEAWGGEVLYCRNGSAEFNRVAHLEQQLLLGGDLASRFPMRLAAAMLSKAGLNVDKWLLKNSRLLSYGEMEAELILNQLKQDGGVQTTSCGRVLDAVSALLGLCTVRTYEGEPAMRLESAAILGKDILKLEPHIYGNILGTSRLIKAIYENLGKESVADLAYSAHVYLAEGLGALAIEQAGEKDTENVGFTGGVACNQLFAQQMRRIVEAAGLRFWVHESVPAGDGGVSFGQAVVAGFSDF